MSTRINDNTLAYELNPWYQGSNAEYLDELLADGWQIISRDEEEQQAKRQAAAERLMRADLTCFEKPKPKRASAWDLTPLQFMLDAMDE